MSGWPWGEIISVVVGVPLAVWLGDHFFAMLDRRHMRQAVQQTNAWMSGRLIPPPPIDSSADEDYLETVIDVYKDSADPAAVAAVAQARRVLAEIDRRRAGGRVIDVDCREVGNGN